MEWQNKEFALTFIVLVVNSGHNTLLMSEVWVVNSGHNTLLMSEVWVVNSEHNTLLMSEVWVVNSEHNILLMFVVKTSRKTQVRYGLPLINMGRNYLLFYEPGTLHSLTVLRFKMVVYII